MYAIIDSKTMEIVGQCLAMYDTREQHFVPLDEELYVKMMDDPRVYREYRAVKDERGILRLKFVPKWDFSDSRFNQVFEDSEAETRLEIDALNVTLKSVYGLLPVDVMVFNGLDDPVFHAMLEVNKPVPHSQLNPRLLQYYIAKPAIGYSYGLDFK